MSHEHGTIMLFAILSQVTLTTFKRILRTPIMSGETSVGHRRDGREGSGQQMVRWDRWGKSTDRENTLSPYGAPVTAPDNTCPVICSISVALHNTH